VFCKVDLYTYYPMLTEYDTIWDVPVGAYGGIAEPRPLNGANSGMTAE
jgi:hypothetical protein